jgi:hypothetical protein
MAKQGFSVAATLLSYFLVAGGIVLALILLVQAKLEGELVFYAALALGGVAGGAIAARASRGSTILEPAIGGLLVIATLVLVFVGTDVSTILWTHAPDDIVRIVGIAGACAAAGAIVGAIGAEKLPGPHSVSALSWLFHAAFSTLGSCFVAMIGLGGAMARGTSDDDKLAGVMFGAMAIGALLTGLAVGASAPRRVLLVTWLGTILGTIGFWMLMAALPGVENDDAGKTFAGSAIIGVGAGLVAMLGAAIGWAVVGRRRAQSAETTARAFA